MAGNIPGQPAAPFKRVLTADPAKGGPTTGTDVVAVKRVASRLGCWPWQQFNDIFHAQFSHGVGPAKVRSGVAGVQKLLGLPITGNWTADIHDKTLATRVPKGLAQEGEWAWDQPALNLYRAHNEMTEAHQLVAQYFDVWDVLVANNGIWDYNEEIRPIQPIKDQKKPLDGGILDCSGTCIAVGWWTNCKPMDPVLRYTGWGNTDSLHPYGTPIPETDIDKWSSDHVVCAFYGSDWNHTTHMVAVKSSKPNDVYSNGRTQAPERWDNIHHMRRFLGLRAYNVI